MKKQNNLFFACLIAFLAVILIFWQVFLRSSYPFPGNYLLAWYEPWKTEFFNNGTITIAHKPVADDAFRQIYPFKILASDIIKKTQLPLWNPYNGAGMPLMATMHVGFLNPFNVFFLLLPPFFAWTLYIAIQPFLIVLFTYLYSRKIGLSFFASIFSSIVFVFSGFVITRLIFGEYIYVLSMLPLLLFAIESYLNKDGSKFLFFIPFIVFFTFISGHPQMIFYVLIFTIIYAFYRCLQLKQFKKLLSIYLMSVIGVGLSTIQLLPTIQLFRNANVNTESSKFIFDRFLMPLQHLITIFIPNYFGNQATYNYWGSGDYIETVASLGLIPCFFAFITFFEIIKNKNIIRFYWIILFLTIIFALNWFGSRLLFSIPIPIISTGAPSRIFALTTFSISILSGIGFDYWIKTSKLSKKLIYRILIFSVFVVSILSVTFLLYKLNFPCHNEIIANCRDIALRNTLIEVFSLFSFLFFFIFYILNKKSYLKKIIPIIVILEIVILGFYNSSKFLPFSKKETFLPNNELFSIIKTNFSDARILGLGQANIKTDFATYFKYYDPNFYDPLYIKRYGELVSFANSGNYKSVLPRSDVEIINDINLEKDDKDRRDRLFNILGVGYLIYKKSEIKSSKNMDKNILWKNNNWIIVKNDNALPKVYFVNKFETIPDKEIELKKLFNQSFDPSKQVLLEQKPSVNFNIAGEQKISNLTNIKNYQENQIILTTSTSTDSILVLSDNYYPGWKAFIDKNEVPIYRANYAFRGIFVPKGNHLIRFIYEPYSLMIGFYISLASGFIYITIILIFKKIKTKKSF